MYVIKFPELIKHSGTKENMKLLVVCESYKDPYICITLKAGDKYASLLFYEF